MTDSRTWWMFAAAAVVFALAYVNVGGVPWTSFVQLVVSGLVFGSIYGLVALAYNIVFATRNIINFALGEIVVVGMLVGWSLTTVLQWPWPAALPVACAAAALIAVAVEPIAVKPIGNVRTNLAWVMSTFGFGIALKEIVTLIWGREPLAFPRFIGGTQPLEISFVRILPQELAIILAAVGLTIAYQAFTRSSIWGAAIRAVAQDQRTAELMGIDARRVVYLAYALSGAVGGLAGFFIAPITFADPQYGIVIAVSGFIAAVIGGLGRVSAGFLGGIFLGLLENLATGLFAVQWKEVCVFAALLVVMVVRPHGLFAGVGGR